MPNVSNVVKTIQDIMRKDAGTYGDAQRLEQLGWMFFLKIFDDRETEIETIRGNYKSPLPQHLRWRNWAADAEGITGDGLLDFVNNTLLPKLKALRGGEDKIAGLIRMAFEDANNFMKNGTLMRQVINKINGIDFNSSDDRHMFGDIYEKLLKDLQSAGNAGEFYTPRAVTQFIVDQVNPRLGESILDPACGTGGFLVSAIEHLKAQAKTEADQETIQTSFAGIEKKHLPHILCMTNLLLHGIDVPSSVRHDNTLARPLRDWTPKERVDVIVTNPPFGGMEEDGIEANFPAEFRTRETADLFLVLLMKLLKPGGRAGIVLPDGTLFGEGVKTRIKEALLRDCNLHTIVRLPNGVFNPYTGIRTNLLFFTKGAPTTTVWYYEHPYPPGAKSYNKGKPIRIEEFDVEKAWWGSERDGFAARVENEQAWRVSIDDIKAGNYNLDLRNPHDPDELPGDVHDILREHEELLAQVAATRSVLKAGLSASLVTDGIEAAKLQRFLENFDLVADLPLAHLRHTVIKLAAQGRLVSPDPSDAAPESSLPLFAAVAVERDDNTYPAHWLRVPLGSAGEWRGGGTPSKLQSEYWDGTIPWVSPKDMKVLRISDAQDHISESAVEASSVRIIPANSLLMVVRGMILARAFPVALTTRAVTINQDMKALLPLEAEAAEFLLLALRALEPDVLALIERSTHGTCKLQTEALEALLIPIPPLGEQRRIVAKVEELMRDVDALEAQLTRLQQVGVAVVAAIVADVTLEDYV